MVNDAMPTPVGWLELEVDHIRQTDLLEALT